MSINPPRSSGVGRGSGRSAGGNPPFIGLNLPPAATPSRDPMDSLGTPEGASQSAPASGPIRPVRSSPSPGPYGSGMATPHAQRMSIASQSAAMLGRMERSLSPSPAPSGLSFPASSLGGVEDNPFAPLRSHTPPAASSSEGWRMPDRYAGALEADAVWLDRLRDGGFGELSVMDKFLIANGIGSMIRAAVDTGVLHWKSSTLESALIQLTESVAVEDPPPAQYDQDVDIDMRPPPNMGMPSPSFSSRGRLPKGGRPLPHPPSRGRGGLSKGKGRDVGPPPPSTVPRALWPRALSCRLPVLTGAYL